MAKLDQLLTLIRDDHYDADQLAEAQALVQTDERVPDELRSLVLRADFCEEAGALLGILGHDDGLGSSIFDAIADEMGPSPWERDDSGATQGEWHEQPSMPWSSDERDWRAELASQAFECPILEAIEDESGAIDCVDRVAEALHLASPLQVAEAVQSESGEYDCAERVQELVEGAWVSALLDNELEASAREVAARRLAQSASARLQMTAYASIGRQLKSAARAEAGECDDLWAKVAAQLGLSTSSEVAGWSGELLGEAVRAEAGECDVVQAVMAQVHKSSMPNAAHDEPVIPHVANKRWGLLVAAAAVFAFAVMPLTGSDLTPEVQSFNFELASFSDEIQVLDLQYASDRNVQVYGGADDVPLIIWVDEA